MESPYLFPDMDQLSVHDDLSPKEPPASVVAAPRVLLPSLPTIPNCTMFQPGDAGYAAHVKVYNGRTQTAPALFAVCTTASAVASVFAWIKTNNLPFAVRSGGHSFEGFSCNAAVVIDVKGLNSVVFDKPNMTVTVGAGASIDDIQTSLKDMGVAFIAGTCPTVGIAGHVMGGGYGLLSRFYGLACDNLKSIKLVDAAGSSVTASQATNSDLFWASRGGGGGSLGIATEFVFTVHPISTTTAFGQSWALPLESAIRIIDAWQKWAPSADPGITALLKIGRIDSTTVSLRCLGQSIAPVGILERDLQVLADIEPLSSARTVQNMSFWDAYQHFKGGGADPAYQKEKSDYVPFLSSAGMTTILKQLLAQSSNQIAVIFNAYGGSINRLNEADTAFPHRQSIRYMIHYYSGWADRSATAQRVRAMASFYAGMRPYVPGKAYINYCDRELGSGPINLD